MEGTPQPHDQQEGPQKSLNHSSTIITPMGAWQDDESSPPPRLRLVTLAFVGGGYIQRLMDLPRLLLLPGRNNLLKRRFTS